MPPSPRVNVPSREPAWGEIESDEQVQPFGEELATRRKLQRVTRTATTPPSTQPSSLDDAKQAEPHGLGEQIPPIANDKGLAGDSLPACSHGPFPTSGEIMGATATNPVRPPITNCSKYD
ncbi:hypothetical protein OAG69_00005 [bacterium]|nr:hypothetical protein [bacterium]